MSDMQNGRIREMASRLYNDPPETPREEIWAELQARIADEPIRLANRRERRRTFGWIGLAAAASVALLFGVGLGRMSAPVGVPLAEAPTAEPDAPVTSTGVRTLTVQHLEQSESLLSFVRADAQAGRFDETVGRWGRELLTETRLLLDSDVGDDPALREVLLDLEMLLAQVALLSGTETPERGREELRLIADGMERQQMMTRIRTLLPSVDFGLAGT